MRPDRLALLLVALAACLAFPARAASTVSGEPLAVGPFHALEVSGHAEVILIEGDETVTVEGSPRHPARVRVRSGNGRLRIAVDENRHWFPGGWRPPTITVAFRTLDSLKLSGAVSVSAASLGTPRLVVNASGAASIRIDALETPELRFDGSGAVKADLEGRAATQRVSISGAGTYRAPRLFSEDVTARVSGAGRVVVNAQRTLSASISGAGAIDYYGDPQVEQRIGGAGRITHRGGEASLPPGGRTASISAARCPAAACPA